MSKNKYPLGQREAIKQAARLMVDGYPEDYFRGVVDILADTFGEGINDMEKAVRSEVERLQDANKNKGVIGLILSALSTDTAYSRETLNLKAEAIARLLRANDYLKDDGVVGPIGKAESA